jgi:hypothetical protein
MIRISRQKEPLKFLKWQGKNDEFMLTLLSPHRKTFITIIKFRDEQNQKKSTRIKSLFDKDNMMETVAVPAIKRADPDL